MHYFDNAATTFPKPNEVYDYMNSYYRSQGVNIGRGNYGDPLAAGGLLGDTRNKVLDFFQSKNKRVAFVPSATIGINIVLQGLEWSNNKTIYISPFEHNAVLRTVRYIEQKYGATIRMLKVDRDSLQYDLGAIREQFMLEAPDLVAVSHASNVTGTIAPFQGIFSMAKVYAAQTFLDLAQTAGAMTIDLSSNNIDFAVFPGHKGMYGPFGIAGIILKADAKIAPLVYGGTGFDSASPDVPSSIPERFEVGSMNTVALAGLNASIDWINRTGISEIQEKERLLTDRLLGILKQYPEIEIYRSANEMDSVGVVACNIKGISSDAAAKILSDDFEVALRSGLHCAPECHKFLGTYPEGTLRLSVGYFNSESDFIALTNSLEYIVDNI